MAKTTLGDPDASDTDKAGALVVLALGRGEPLTLAEVTCALTYLFNLMGRAWRIGIDPENRTDLAERGPYRWIRHPIYAGFLVILVGHVLVVPHRVIDVAALVAAAGVVGQALREERHLHRTFGERYARYAAATGGFVPRLRHAR